MKIGGGPAAVTGDKTQRHCPGCRIDRKIWMQGAEERGGKRTFRYVAPTSDEGNAADRSL